MGARLLLLLASLILATPAFGAAAKWNAPAVGPGGAATLTWDAATSGDQSALDARLCRLLSVTAEVSGAGSVSGYATPTPTTATASGTLAFTVSATTRSPTDYSHGPYWLRPTAAAGSSGTLTVRCTGFAARPSTVDSVVTGLNGTIGTARTLAYLSEQAGLKLNARAIRRLIYVDPYLGNDTTGNGTNEQPYRSLAKANAVCRTYVRCVLRSNRVWSPTTWVTPTGGGVAGDDFIIGETASHAGGTVLIRDWQVIDGTPYLVTRDITGTLGINTQLTGLASGATWTTPGAVTNNLGAASDDVIVWDAAPEFADNVVVSWEGEIATTDRSQWPVIDCNNTDPDGTPGGGLFYGGDVDGIGWMAVQRIRVEACRVDAITSVSGASADPRMIAFNFDCRVSNTETGGNNSNNCLTTHGLGGSMIFVNASARSAVTSNSGAGSPIAINEGSALGLNFEATADLAAAGASGRGTAITGGEVTLINGKMGYVNTASIAYGLEVNSTNDALVLRLARLAITGSTVSGSWSAVFSGTTNALDVLGWNISLKGARGMYVLGHASRADSFQLFRMIHDGTSQGAGSNYLYIDGTAANLNPFVLRGAYDDSDSSDIWHLPAGDRSTLATFLAIAPAHYDVFEAESADLAGTDAYGAMPDLPCFDSTKTACWEVAPSLSYFVSLPPILNGHLPPELVDGVTKLTGFSLGGGVDSNGAW
jgi:hypothetical protein